MKKLICSTFREGYGIDQIRRTMTAGELINFLAQYDEDTPVYLSFDNGYYSTTQIIENIANEFKDLCKL